MNLVDDLNTAITLMPENSKKSAYYKRHHELESLRDWLLNRNIYSISDLERQFEFCLWIQERDVIKGNK